MKRKSTVLGIIGKIVLYVFLIGLAVLSVMPFVIMIVNATRSTTQIQQHAISFIPSSYAMNNLKVLTGKSFEPMVGIMNSLIISVGVTICTIYFSTLTAYSIVVYDWKLKKAFFAFAWRLSYSSSHQSPTSSNPASRRPCSMFTTIWAFTSPEPVPPFTL